MISDFYARRPITAWVFTIGALLVLAWAFFGRAFASSSGSQDQVITASQGPSPDAMLASSTQVQLAQIASAADATRAENEAQLGLANIALQNTLGQAQLLNEDRDSERTYQTNIYNIQTGERLGIAQLDAQSNALSITAALETAQDNNSTAIELERIRSNAATNAALIQSNVDIVTSNNNAANTASNNARRTSRSNGILGVIGGVLGGIFSDVRLKSNIVRCGTLLDLPLYEYSYTAEAHAMDTRLPHGRVRGFLAQDVLQSKYASAVGQRGGYLTLDYGAMK